MWPFKKKPKPKVLSEKAFFPCDNSECVQYRKMHVRHFNTDWTLPRMGLYRKLGDPKTIFLLEGWIFYIPCLMCEHFEHQDLLIPIAQLERRMEDAPN